MTSIIERANAETRAYRNNMTVTRSASEYRGSYYINRANSETYKTHNGDWNRYYTKRDR